MSGCRRLSSLSAHRNYVGDSIVGQDVNLEAGAVLANHFNERADKRIFVRVGGQAAATGLTKFGAVLGDGTRIGLVDQLAEVVR